MDSSENASGKMNFSTYTDKQGRTYVYTYRNKWDPKKQQSRIAERHHVGRLDPQTRQVRVGKAFLALHPEYAGRDWYWAGNSLVSAQDVGEAEPQEPASDEGWEQNETVSMGCTWAAREYCILHGIRDDLKSVFGADLAEKLMDLAIFQFDAGQAMMLYSDWLSGVYLPGARPLSSQRISEVLEQVDRDKLKAYFKLRFKRSAEEARQRSALIKASLKPGSYVPPQMLALDSTSISTYSETIRDAAYGHAKQNPELRQVNLAFVCDYVTGEAVFAHIYEGSITAAASFREILFQMRDEGIELDKMLLVTDRGYSSIMNTQKSLEMNLRFVQGVRVVEDSVKRKFDKHRKDFEKPACQSGLLEVAAVTAPDAEWRSNRQDVKVALHLYRNNIRAAKESFDLLKAIEKALKKKNEGRSVDSQAWQDVKNFLTCTKDDSGRPVWKPDYEAIEKETRYYGCFVLRTNEIADPFAALEIYRERNVVEQSFDQFKNEIHGDRIRSTDSTYIGRLFIYILAQTLRTRMSFSARAQTQSNSDLKLPGNSLTLALAKLRNVQATKLKTHNKWVSQQLAKKHRDLFTMLGLPVPPRVLKD